MYKYKSPTYRKRDWIEKTFYDGLKKSDPTKVSKLLEDEDIFHQIFNEQLTFIIKEVKKDFEIYFKSTLKEHQWIRNEFNQNLSHRWRKAFDRLEGFIHATLEYGENLRHSVRKDYPKNVKFAVLIRLHAKACLTASEILQLLRNGYADGAMARWRSLYEIAIVSKFIEQNPEPLAQQFIDYSIIQQYKDALNYQEQCQKLGFRPYTKKQMEKMFDAKNNMMDKYGKVFWNDYGWTTNYLGSNDRTFRGIEKQVQFEQFRPYYKMASHNVHSGPKSILFQLGLYKQNKVLLAGPSNYGLADPGKNTAYALFLSTLTIYSFEKYVEGSVFIKIAMDLVGEIGDIFMKIQSDIENEEKAKRKRK